MIDILLGPEEGLKNKKIDSLKEQDRKIHPDMESSLYFGGDDDVDTLSSDLNEPSLFSSFRFVTIKSFESAKKSGRMAAIIDEFAKNPLDSVHLVISSSESKPTNFPSSLSSELKSAEKFYELYERDKKNIVYREALNRGITVTEDGVNEILRSTEGISSDIETFSREVFSFFQESGKKKIDSSDIEKYTSRSKDEDGYTLFDAICNRDLSDSILILKSILLNDSSRIPSTFTVISNQFRLLESVIEDYSTSGDLKATFRDVTYFSLYAPKGTQKKGVFFKEEETLKRGMENYTLSDVRRIILYLGKMDTIIKGSNSEILPIVLDKIIYDIVVNKGKENAVDIDPPTWRDPFRN